MTGPHPFDPLELDHRDASLEDVAAQLQAVAADESEPAPPDLAARIQARIDREPPVVGAWAGLLSRFGGSGFGTALAAAAVLAVAVVGAIAFAELVGWVRQPDVGASPTPTLSAPPVTQSPSPSPSPTPSVSPSPTPLPSPTESDDDERETPEPSESEDERETPEPTEFDDDDDNSGPGGGDNSGPGGGGNSGPGGGDDD